MRLEWLLMNNTSSMEGCSNGACSCPIPILKLACLDGSCVSWLSERPAPRTSDIKCLDSGISRRISKSVGADKSGAHLLARNQRQ